MDLIVELLRLITIELGIRFVLACLLIAGVLRMLNS